MLHLTKRTKDLIFKEWLKEINYYGYITKIKTLCDKEFLTFNVNSGIALIGNGFMAYTDQDVLKISYPKVRNITEKDIKNFLGEADIFENEANGISIRFHVTDKADYFVTIALDVSKIGETFDVCNEDIYFDTKEDLERIEKEREERKREEEKQRKEKEKEEERQRLEKEKAAQVQKELEKQFARKKRLNNELEYKYYKTMQDEIKADVSLCITIKDLKELNKMLLFMNVGHAITTIKELEEVRKDVKRAINRNYSLLDMARIIKDKNISNKEELFAVLKK